MELVKKNDFKSSLSNRYFAPKWGIFERDVKFKRLRPEGKNQTKWECLSEAIVENSKILNNEALESKTDEMKWLQFLDYQNIYGRRKHSIAERKLAILEKALELNPESATLLREFIVTAENQWTPNRLNTLWELVLQKHSKMPSVWTLYTNFSLSLIGYQFALSKSREVFTKTFEKLKNSISTDSPHWKSLKRLFLRRIRLELSAGRYLMAIALIQIQLEANVRFRDENGEIDFYSLEAFWDCGFERIGSDCIESNSSGTIGFDHCTVKKEENVNFSFYKAVRDITEIGEEEPSFNTLKSPIYSFKNIDDLVTFLNDLLEIFGFLTPLDLKTEFEQSDRIEIIEELGLKENDTERIPNPIKTTTILESFFKGTLNSLEKLCGGDLSIFLLKTQFQLRTLKKRKDKTNHKNITKSLRERLETDPKDIRLWLLYAESEKQRGETKRLRALERTLLFLQTKLKNAEEKEKGKRSIKVIVWELFRRKLKAKSFGEMELLPLVWTIVDPLKEKTTWSLSSLKLYHRGPSKKIDTLLQSFVTPKRPIVPPKTKERMPNLDFLANLAVKLLTRGIRQTEGFLMDLLTAKGVDLNVETYEEILWLVECFDDMNSSTRISQSFLILLLPRFPTRTRILKAFLRVFKTASNLRVQGVAFALLKRGEVEDYERKFVKTIPLLILRLQRAFTLPQNQAESEILRGKREYERASEDSTAKSSPFFWRLWLIFEGVSNKRLDFLGKRKVEEKKLGHVRQIAHQKNSNAFKVFLRAVKECPCSRVLWRDGFEVLEDELEESDLMGLKSLANQTEIFDK